MRAFYGLEDATGEPIVCASAGHEARFSLCPDPGCAEEWAAASDGASGVCGEPPTVAFVLAPPDPGELDALRAALVAADTRLADAGGQGVLVLATDPPQTLPLAAAATADLSAAADISGALTLAREALSGVENAGLVVFLPDISAADAFSPALTELPLGGVSMRVIGPAEALAALPALDATLRPTEDAALELVRAARAYAEAARALPRSAVRAMSCGTLGVRATIGVDGLSDSRSWTQRIACPNAMDPALQGQFFVDPMGGGLGQATWRYGFGPRRFTDGTYSFHPGIDVEAPEGAALFAAAPGLVIQAGPRAGYEGSGNFVVIDHGGGLQSWYLHMREVAVTVGQAVDRGEPIGAVGSSGANWAHLHFSLVVCPGCAAGALGDYATQTVNPAWLLPRPERAAHSVTVLAVDAADPASAAVTLAVTAPGDELDFNTLNLSLGGVFSGTVDLEQRLGCADASGPTDGLWTVEPNLGPWTDGVTWTITLGPVDLRSGSGEVSAEAIDLWGNAITAP